MLALFRLFRSNVALCLFLFLFRHLARRCLASVPPFAQISANYVPQNMPHIIHMREYAPRHKNKKTEILHLGFLGGKGGIRTHGTVEPYAGFRVRSIRPLWHLSFLAVQIYAFLLASQKKDVCFKNIFSGICPVVSHSKLKVRVNSREVSFSMAFCHFMLRVPSSSGRSVSSMSPKP